MILLVPNLRSNHCGCGSNSMHAGNANMTHLERTNTTTTNFACSKKCVLKPIRVDQRNWSKHADKIIDEMGVEKTERVCTPNVKKKKNVGKLSQTTPTLRTHQRIKQDVLRDAVVLQQTDQTPTPSPKKPINSYQHRQQITWKRSTRLRYILLERPVW